MSKSAKRVAVNNLYYFSKKTQKFELTYDQVIRASKFITRANDPTKTIGNKQSKTLLASLAEKLLASKEGVIFVDHDYISSITDCQPEQNGNILKQLADILDYEYHRSIIFEGRRRHYGLIIKFTDDGIKRVQNPELFYDIKPPQNSQKETTRTPKKFGHHPEKNRGSYIDKKEILGEVEERAYGSVSSTKEENKIKEETIEPSSLATSSLAELASDLVLHQAGEEIRTEANAFPNKLTTVSEATAMGSAEEREHYASHQHRDCGSGLMAIHELSIMTNLLITPVPEEYPTEESVIDSYVTTEIIEAEIIPEEEITPMGIQLKPTPSKPWQEVREKMMNSYEEEVDRWDLKWIFNELEVEESLERKILFFKGSGYVIDSLKNKKGNHWKRFTTSFYEVMPDYSFEFVEINTKTAEENHDSAA